MSSSSTTTAFIANELSFFKEKGQIIALINDLCTINSEYQYEKYENIVENIKKILDNYQEQPQLLGPHIADILDPINKHLIQCLTFDGFKVNFQFHAICDAVHVICKVRGYKNVSKHLPHEVHHFEPAFDILKHQDRNDFATWRTRYVLWLWLGTLSLIPFDLSSIDSSAVTSDKRLSIVNSVIDLGKLYLSDTGSTREAAGVCLSGLLTRPDIDSDYLEKFLEFCLDYFKFWIHQQKNISAESSANILVSTEYFNYLGILFCLNQVFKRGHREKLKTYSSRLLPAVLDAISVAAQTLDRKFLCKLVQRITLSFLSPKEAPWRYLRGFRSLKMTLLATEQRHDQDETLKDDDCEFEEFPDDMENVVSCMLGFVGDKDTVVRWSAAKGIGRITMRLNKLLGNDIVDAVINLFDDENDENLWHGACLTLAELSRRGLLLPTKLDCVVPILLKALHFDKSKGSYGVGIHIRDAACYVCWAFARAYSPVIMNKYIKDILIQLLLISLFDREINCRRAASAAFQENIGRQGHELFDFGLEIISIADFFSVSNRIHTYLYMSKQIASFHRHYCQCFIRHLIKNGINHWDEDIRMVAAKSIGQLLTISEFISQSNGSTTSTFQTEYSLSDKEYLSEIEILNELLRLCTSEILNVRHGAIYAAAWTIFVLSQKLLEFPAETLKSIEEIIPLIEKKRLFRGRGGELIRRAANFFMEIVSQTNLGISIKVRFQFLDLINEHLKHPQSLIQNSAVKALRMVLFQYFGKFSSALTTMDRLDLTTSEQQQLNIISKLSGVTTQKYISYLKTIFANKNEENVAIYRGYTRALGVFPRNILSLAFNSNDDNNNGLTLVNVIFQILDEFCDMTKTIGGEYDAETSANCVQSLVDIYHRFFPILFMEQSKLSETTSLDHYVYLFQRFIHKASYDYSVDKRGDTGSWTRSAAMEGIFYFFQSYYEYLQNPNETLFRFSNTNDTMSEISLVGRKVLTPFGIGTIQVARGCAKEKGTGKMAIWVNYPIDSYGDKVVTEENWMESEDQCGRRGMNLFIYDSLTLQNFLIELQTENVPDIKIHEDVIAYFISILLKQLAEKLDSVRETAGRLLLKILENFVCLSGDDPKRIFIPHGKVIYDCIIAQANRLKSEVSDSMPNCQMINWSQPDHVYPILVDIMVNSSTYFHHVFCGYVISIGDITETITKKSSFFLLQKLSIEKTQLNDGTFQENPNNLLFLRINESISKLFETHKDIKLGSKQKDCNRAEEKLKIPFNLNYHDRIMLSLMKTIEILLKNSYFETYYKYISALSDDKDSLIVKYHEQLTFYYERILEELRSSSSISKIQLGVDILSSLLSNDFEGSLRKRAITSLVLFLGHRFPRIRKYTAEVLYIILLGDNSLVVPNCAEQIGFFYTMEDHTLCVDLLISTSWDSDQREGIVEKRNKILELMNMQTVLQKVSQQKSSKVTTRLNKVEVKDELESYEALVRDAGY